MLNMLSIRLCTLSANLLRLDAGMNEHFEYGSPGHFLRVFRTAVFNPFQAFFLKRNETLVKNMLSSPENRCPYNENTQNYKKKLTKKC